MEAVRSDDADALQLLIHRHWPPLVRFAERSLGCREDAEDVAQETFVRLWRGREGSSDYSSVCGYLYKIARNLIIDSTRRAEVRRRSGDVLGRQARKRAVSPLDEAIGHDVREDFENALTNLPQRRREAFVLVRLQGLGLSEAAEAMGLTPRTVANHVYLAVNDLAVALGEHLSS